MSATHSSGSGSTLVPGEIIAAEGAIELNAGAPVVEVTVVNSGDRPVQVGSHVHFPQSNPALEFDRALAHGRRLDIPAGTAVRFEPGIEMTVALVPLGGTREVYGISLDPPGQCGPVRGGPVRGGPVQGAPEQAPDSDESE